MNSDSRRPPGPRTVAHGAPAFGPFAVLSKLGEGGMGAVYLAEDTKLKRRVAIKTMRPELASDPANRDRFEREARAAAAVEHDNIVPILHVEEAADGTPYIVMPFLKGEPLDARLKREPVSPLWLLLKVAREVAEGLAAAHAAGLIHRDIKPANIWLEGDPTSPSPTQQVKRCKVLDFGLARSVGDEDVQLTKARTVLGTPAFMAPEQARGEKVDARADLFSLGATLYRMATGKLPFRGSTTVAVLSAVLTEAPVPIRDLASHLPPELHDLTEQLMNKDPNSRLQTAAAISTAVRLIVQDARATTGSYHAPPAAAPSSSPLNTWGEVIGNDTKEPPVTCASTGREKSTRRRSLGVVGGICATLLMLTALAAVVIRFETPEGTLVVEINDPDVEVRYKNGRLVLYGADGKERYTLTSAERNKKVDAGKYTVRVEGADGLTLETSEFVLKKKGEVVVRVALAAPKTAAKKELPDANRAAAEWVFGVGGLVFVNDQKKGIRDTSELPVEPFRLTLVSLRKSKFSRPADLTCLAGCLGLTRLELDGTPITDADLAYLKGSTRLRVLCLDATAVSDVGLAHLNPLTNLTELTLLGTRVTEAGLKAFTTKMPQCKVMWDGGTINPVRK